MNVRVDQAGKDGEVGAVMDEGVCWEFGGAADGLDDAFFDKERNGVCLEKW